MNNESTWLLYRTNFIFQYLGSCCNEYKPYTVCGSISIEVTCYLPTLEARGSNVICSSSHQCQSGLITIKPNCQRREISKEAENDQFICGGDDKARWWILCSAEDRTVAWISSATKPLKWLLHDSRLNGSKGRLVVSSVTRFGDISPLWQIFESLWPIFAGSSQHLHNLLNLFGHIFMLLGKFWLLQMAKCWKLCLAIWSHW